MDHRVALPKPFKGPLLFHCVTASLIGSAVATQQTATCRRLPEPQASTQIRGTQPTSSQLKLGYRKSHSSLMRSGSGRGCSNACIPRRGSHACIFIKPFHPILQTSMGLRTENQKQKKEKKTLMESAYRGELHV